MKKLKLIVLPVLVLVLVIAGCDSSSSGGGGGLDYDVMVNIGAAIYNFGDEFVLGIKNSIEDYALGKANVDIVNSNNSQSTQNDQIDKFISDEVDAMIINPVNSSDVGPIIEKAMAANIPVVFVNRQPAASELAKWNKFYYVDSDSLESGMMQGEIAYDYWKANKSADKNGDGIIQYIMLKGPTDNNAAVMRTQYSIKYLTDKGVKVECLEEYIVGWSFDFAKTKMAEFISSYGDNIEMVFGNNDDIALGAIDALLAAGYFQGGKYMPVIGVDGTSGAFNSIAAGYLLGTVLQSNRDQGRAAFDLAYALAANKDISSAGWKITDGKYVWVPHVKITRDNYQNYR